MLLHTCNPVFPEQPGKHKYKQGARIIQQYSEIDEGNGLCNGLRQVYFPKGKEKIPDGKANQQYLYQGFGIGVESGQRLQENRVEHEQYAHHSHPTKKELLSFGGVPKNEVEKPSPGQQLPQSVDMQQEEVILPLIKQPSGSQVCSQAPQ